MSTAITVATQGLQGLHFEVCPGYINGACACPTNPDKTLAKPHPAFTFAASSGDSKDTRTPTQWQQACATEALLLAAQAAVVVATGGTPLTALVGKTI